MGGRRLRPQKLLSSAASEAIADGVGSVLGGGALLLDRLLAFGVSDDEAPGAIAAGGGG